jgi:hypothetical protein
MTHLVFMWQLFHINKFTRHKLPQKQIYTTYDQSQRHGTQRTKPTFHKLHAFALATIRIAPHWHWYASHNTFTFRLIPPLLIFSRGSLLCMLKPKPHFFLCPNLTQSLACNVTNNKWNIYRPRMRFNRLLTNGTYIDLKWDSIDQVRRFHTYCTHLSFGNPSTFHHDHKHIGNFFA